MKEVEEDFVFKMRTSLEPSLFAPIEYAKAFDDLQNGVRLLKYSKSSESGQPRIFSMKFHESSKHNYLFQYPKVKSLSLYIFCAEANPQKW